EGLFRTDDLTGWRLLAAGNSEGNRRGNGLYLVDRRKGHRPVAGDGILRGAPSPLDAERPAYRARSARRATRARTAVPPAVAFGNHRGSGCREEPGATDGCGYGWRRTAERIMAAYQALSRVACNDGVGRRLLLRSRAGNNRSDQRARRLA